VLFRKLRTAGATMALPPGTRQVGERASESFPLARSVYDSCVTLGATDANRLVQKGASERFLPAGIH
jgi:hypothetical protein